jgi:hypothetical protein
MSKWAEFRTSAQATYAFAHTDMRDMVHIRVSRLRQTPVNRQPGSTSGLF